MLRVDTLAMISRRLTCLALHKQHQSSWGAPLYYTISCPCTNVDSYTAQTVVTTFARLQPGHQVKQIHQGTDPVQLYPNPDQLLQQPTVCVPHALQGGHKVDLYAGHALFLNCGFNISSAPARSLG